MCAKILNKTQKNIYQGIKGRASLKIETTQRMAHRKAPTNCTVEIGTEDTIIDQYKIPHTLYQSVDY